MKYISLYKHTYLTLIFILITILVNGQSNKTDSVLFEFTGTTKTWTVPTGVTSLWVDAMGAEGGGRQAGKGGRVQCLLPVKPGDKLTITVGGQATNDAGGYNGGGTGCGKGFGGGGATDIRLNGNDLDARIVVAGGGGGIGYGGYGGAGGGQNPRHRRLAQPPVFCGGDGPTIGLHRAAHPALCRGADRGPQPG